MSEKIDQAFILGAGFGTRLRPYTNDIPKPMVQVADRSMVWHTLDKLKAVGVSRVIVNTHYLADKLSQHLKEYDGDIEIIPVYEETILDTGGGVKNALPYFENKPFFVIAGDNLWTDSDLPALEKLLQHWDAEKMDILTLMQPIDKMVLTHGVGDYDFVDEGRVRRSKDQTGTHMWTNIRINTPEIYSYQADSVFSFIKILDEAEKHGRLYALEHDGEWHHISTPSDLEAVDRYVRKT